MQATVATPKTIRDYEIERIPPETLARIRKMMAVAEVKAGEDISVREGEVANALAMASRMMAEFNLSMEDVQQLSAEAKREEEEAKKPIHKVTQVATSSIEMQWKLALGHAVAEANFCELLSNRTAFFVIGRPHNVQMVHELLANLFPQVDRLAKYASGHRKKTGDAWRDREIMYIPTPTYRLSYCLGIASFIGKRLAAQRNTDSVELQGTQALVLDTKGANRRYLEETWPDTFGPKAKRRLRSRGYRGNQTNSSAWSHGYSEGGKVDTSVDARRVTTKVTPALGNGR